MDIRIEPIPLAQKAVLARMMELYQYDFSEYTGDDLDEQGYFGYRYIDAYWREDGRYPYFILVDGKLAGFVLVRSCSEYSDLLNPHNIAEFFVMRKYRFAGVGRTAAIKVFDKFSGGWEVSCLSGNLPSRKFWERVIAEYTSGNYSVFDASEKVGFTFDNSLK